MHYTFVPIAFQILLYGKKPILLIQLPPIIESLLSFLFTPVSSTMVHPFSQRRDPIHQVCECPRVRLSVTSFLVYPTSPAASQNRIGDYDEGGILT